MTATASAPTSVRARMERWTRFLSPDAAPGFMFLVNYTDPEANLPPAPPCWPELKQERIEWAWQYYEYMMKQAEWLHDDRVPFLDNLTGTEIFAEALGCPVERPGHTMPFAHPFVREAEQAKRVRVPDLGESSLAYLFEIADELHRRGGPGAAMRLVDVQSPMDIAALVWAKEDLFIAMVEEPEAVKELAAKARQILTAFFDEWFCRYGTDYVAHFPTYYMRGGLTLSEDEIGAVNPEMFEEFFLPELAALSERYGGLGIHCCADSQHQWPGLRRVPGLRLLNLGKPPARDPVDFVCGAYRYFGNHCVQMHHGWIPEGGHAAWPAQLPPGNRTVFEIYARTRNEALAIVDALNASPLRFY